VFILSQSDVLKSRIPCVCERYANLKNPNEFGAGGLVGPPGFEPGTDGL